MTEREAWEALAKDAGRERARLERGEGMFDANCGSTYNGLCGGLLLLKVSEVTRRRMKARIARERHTRLRLKNGDFPAYLWPLTSSGFKRRAAWARKQAARQAR